MNAQAPLSLPEFLDLLASDLLAATPAMLGMHLVRGNRLARIVEVEAYRAADDPASHAYRGITERTAVMFGPPGLAYVYFSYGAHWMLNVTALDRGEAGAILIRAAEPIEGIDEMWERRPKARRPEDLLSGPGKLAPAFDITKADNWIDLFANDREAPPEARPGPPTLPPLRIEPGEPVPEILTAHRVGIAEGKAHDYPWRFIDASRLRWASKPWPV